MISKAVVIVGGKKSRSWFWWGINLGVLLALGLWWWLYKRSKPVGTSKLQPLVIPQDERLEKLTSVEVMPPTKTTDRIVEKSDNLKIIEGIGPRCAQVLVEAGVLTFRRLAAMDADAIQAILRAGGVRVPYPETWPEQAALAAGGDFEALKELQGTLKGGRRV